jgi:O-antigen/teichoic acid export membrane protein
VTTASGVREGLTSVTRGTLLLLVATLCFVGLNFVARVIIVRSVTPPEWTAFSLALTLVGVTAAIGTLGLPSAVARSLPYAASDNERRAIVRSALVVGGLAAVVASLALWLLTPWISMLAPHLGPALEVFPVAVGASVAMNLIAAVFQGYEDVTPNALFVQMVTPGLFVAFLAVDLVVSPTGVAYEGAVLAYVAANVAALVLTILYTVERLPKVLAPGPREAGALGPLMRFAAPLFLVSLAGTLSGSGDTLVLGVLHPSDVGTYTASVTLARLLQIGVGAASYIFLPVAARFLREKATAAVAVVYTTVTKWMILFSLPLLLLFLFASGRSLDLVYGSRYDIVVLPLQITVVGAFLTTVFGPAANAQVAFAQTRLLALNSVVSVAVDLGLAFALVPAYGMTGAAIAWAAATAVSTGLSLAQLALLTSVHPFRPHFLVPLLVTGLPVAALLFLLPGPLPLWSLPLIGLGIAGWFVLAVLGTRSVDEGDRLLLNAVEGLFGRPLPLLRRIGRMGLPRAPR